MAPFETQEFMMSVTVPQIPPANGEPAWETAFLLPSQGQWSEADFLKFHTNRMAELVDGRLEILSMQTLKHQRILRWLLGIFEAAASTGSVTLFAPLPTRLFPGTIREPDLLYIAPENAPGPDVDYPTRIDLALEIVSPGSEARARDYEHKRRDYARAGIAEYWIVDRKRTPPPSGISRAQPLAFLLSSRASCLRSARSRRSSLR